MCVDHNECHDDNPCHNETENCSNDLGKYVCNCKFGYTWSNQKNGCVVDDTLNRSLKRFSGFDPDDDNNKAAVEARISYFNVLLTLLFAYLSCSRAFTKNIPL